MTHYQVLEVAENASYEEIKKAYRKKALLHHPDLHKEQQNAQKEKFVEIKKAYEVLVNPSTRALYDLQLKNKLEGPINEEFWKYAAQEQAQRSEFTTRKKAPKSRKQTIEEEAASWEAEKQEAKFQKVRSAMKEHKTRMARQIRMGYQLRGFWQSHARITWPDAALVVCCLCFCCILWNNSKLKLKLKDS